MAADALSSSPSPSAMSTEYAGPTTPSNLHSAPPASVAAPAAPTQQETQTTAGQAAGATAREPSISRGSPGRHCPKCKSGGGAASRNLVVCIDGTSNQFSRKNTNVVELYSRLVKDGTQLTFYNSGIGTYAKPSWKSWSYRKQVLANKLDLAFALRFEKIIISAYAWLVDNYQKGDRIFLFGFSRGAYQVRALAAMIQTVGLLHKGNNDQIPFAYELYAASGKEDVPSSAVINRMKRSQWARRVVSQTEHVRRKLQDELAKVLPRKKAAGNVTVNEGAAAAAAPESAPFPASSWRGKLLKVFSERKDKPRAIPRPKPQTSAQSRDWDEKTLQERFKDTFSREVGIHFVGAWDTVSSVGFVRDKTLPGTTDGMDSVCYFRHALALHEYRVKFLPEYANGGNGPHPFSTQSELGEQPHTKEVWFTGSHSDIGGGSSANTALDKFGPSLRWMSREATIAGLKFEDRRREWVTGRVSQSMTWVWRLIECLPVKRLTYKGKHSVSWRPHFCEDRSICPGQLVHQTVYDECDTAGLPDFVEMEPDEYTTAKAFIIFNPQAIWEKGLLWKAEDLLQLEILLSFEAGCQSLDDLAVQINQSIGETARFWQQHKETDRARYNKLMTELSLFQDRISYRSFDVQTRMAPLSQSLGIASTDKFPTYPFPLKGHNRSVRSVAFLSPQLVVSGSIDDTLRIWNVETGEAVGNPLTTHSDSVNCIAISPDGSLVASGSDDRTIRTWKFASGRLVGEGLVIQGDGMGDVRSVAFSPDGLRLASGSSDGALRMWDAASGQQVGHAMEGHSNWVWSVAFSSDGVRIASGSQDHTVRLWDAKTLQPLGGPLIGHTAGVGSVAFCQDGVSIVSGSGDATIRIWNSHTGELIHTLTGHDDAVWSVAFSPSGRLIASASWDNTLRLWDAVTGEAVGVLKGHTSSAYSTAFSPDGTRLASGSFDGTVRIWDRIFALSTATI